LRDALASQQAHAIRLHGPAGVGQFDLALALVQAWLCEAQASPLRFEPACGECPSCRLVQAHSHPDLMVLLPEALRESLGWGSADDEGDSAAESGSKRKPSKDIRVEEVRRILGFAQTTAARGRGKMVVLFPAGRMNAVSANALLKTLEEPPGDMRFVLVGASGDALLPTIRSRCQSLHLAAPDAALASEWLGSQGVPHPEVLLAATGGQPQEALAWFRDGIDAQTWLALPQQIRRGEVGSLSGWPIARVVETLFKLCHDAMRVAQGGMPTYFFQADLGRTAGLQSLARWHTELSRMARHAEHPWQGGLTIDCLVMQARLALTPASGR
jgi:DNA polymerase-3 subunit delta'